MSFVLIAAVPWGNKGAAGQWYSLRLSSALGRELVKCSNCHRTHLEDMEMEKNSLQHRSGLEDKCSLLLHPWGLGALSPLCSRSQPHRDLMEPRALLLHSMNLMQGQKQGCHLRVLRTSPSTRLRLPTALGKRENSTHGQTPIFAGSKQSSPTWGAGKRKKGPSRTKGSCLAQAKRSRSWSYHAC